MADRYDDEPKDWTGELGSLPSWLDYQQAHPAACPMYSYDRPASLFWQGFAVALQERGLTEEQVREELRSKGTRWMLDRWGDRLEALGRELADEYELCVTPEPAD